MTYGSKLRNLREKQRLSQQEVADMLNISQSTYNHWENDKTTFKVEHLMYLAEIFKVKPLELIPFETLLKEDTGATIKEHYPESTIDVKELLQNLLKTKEEIIDLLKLEIQRLKLQQPV